MKYMNFKSVYALLFASLHIFLAGCTESDLEFKGKDTPPNGALPAQTFTTNNLPEEPYAQDAVKIVTNDLDASFYSLELMPDGYYILTTERSYNYNAPVRVAANGDGSVSILKNHKAKAARTRYSTDENGTLTLADGSEYGLFERTGPSQYKLSNGMTFDLQNAANANETVSYTDKYGRRSDVYVNVSDVQVAKGTESLCRSWESNSFEIWLYLNGYYMAHAKQYKENGEIHNYIKMAIGYEDEEVLEDEDLFCKKVIFTKYGTYICIYMDDSSAVSTWAWRDEEQGTLHYNWDEYDYDSNYGNDDLSGDVTVRFAGNQMRIYEDYTYSEDGMTGRTVWVNTLTAETKN